MRNESAPYQTEVAHRMTASITLSRAAPSDAPAIRQLVRAAYAKWVPLMGREPKPMLADYDLAVREHEVDLVYVDGTLAALIELILHPDHLFIENLAIAPGHQRLGLGRRLLAHAEVRAQALGLAEMRLLTAQAMAGNAAFYQSVGYRVTRTEPFKGGFTVYMSKDSV